MTPAEPDAGPTGSGLVVPYRRGWAAPVTALALALLGGALLLAESPAEHLVGGACAVVFGLTAVLLAARNLRSAPALLLDENGLTDTASGAAAGFVPWSAVTGVLERRVRGQHYLSVLVADPGAVLARADVGARAAMQANLVVLDTPVNIPLRPLAIGVAELTCAFARRTPVALPAALDARLPPGTAPRPPATGTDLADLATRAADAGITLPPAYLDLLAAQDGWIDPTDAGPTDAGPTDAGPTDAGPTDPGAAGSGPTGPRVFGSHATPDLDGVLEATHAARVSGLPDDHVVLAQDDAHRYTWRTVSTDFHVLAHSDHRPLARVSTLSDLIVGMLEDFRHPLG